MIMYWCKSNLSNPTHFLCIGILIWIKVRTALPWAIKVILKFYLQKVIKKEYLINSTLYKRNCKHLTYLQNLDIRWHHIEYPDGQHTNTWKKTNLQLNFRIYSVIYAELNTFLFIILLICTLFPLSYPINQKCWDCPFV